MKGTKRERRHSAVFRLYEKLNDRDPFFKDLLIWLLAAVATVCAIALLLRSGSLSGSLAKAAVLSIAGPGSVGLTAAVLTYFGYLGYKKDHPGQKIDRETYIRRRKKAQEDLDARYRSVGDLHRRR